VEAAGETTFMSDVVGGVIFWLLVVVGVFAWIFTPDSWTNAIWYGAQYKVSFNEVHTPRNKPSDCDWGYAPLGRKGCYYKAVVKALNAAGDWVGGDGAPKYSKDRNTGTPIISYDDGKTWTRSYLDATPDLHVKTVRVEWIKVTE
jgi:hypothetical protein